MSIWDHINRLDVEELARQFRTSGPTRYFCIDEFLEPGFAREIAAVYPAFEDAHAQGQLFAWVNEAAKVQITESTRFPDPVRTLNELLASAAFLDAIGAITGIPKLLADPGLAGGGMHIMGPSGHLDVHVDFNMLEDLQLHRRLNILVYLTPDWQEEWDGCFELWDRNVAKRLVKIEPRFNRCVLFNTTDRSFHGVRSIQCPPGLTRNSFAGYYYTEEPPPHWDGKFHNTIYKPRPGEWWKSTVQMPLERLRRARLPRRIANRLLWPFGVRR